MALCSGIRADGGRCQAQAIAGSQWCFNHHPDYEAARRRRASKGGRRGLERPPGESVEREEVASSIRAGRRVRWLRNALEPARERMDEESFERLVTAMCLCVGIESLVVLRDVCGLEAKEAEEVARWAAFTLLRASLRESESSDGGRSGRHGQD